MKKEEHQRILEFMKAIVQYASIDDDKLRVGAVVYRKKAVPLFDFNAYTTKDQVMAGIDQIPYNYRAKAASVASGFETVGSSLLVDSAGYRRDVPNLVVLITDANADTDIIDTIPAAEKLKASGTTIFTVGINVTYNDELSAIASSQAYTLFVDDSSNLQGKDYVLQDQFVGLRTEDLPLIIPAFESTTTTTVTPSTSTEMLKIPAINSEDADIVFLFHVSKKTKTKLFKKYFLKYLANLAIRPDHSKVRFAAVSYGKDAETIFELQHFKSKKLIQKTFRKIPKSKRYKIADLSEALKYVRNKVLTSDNDPFQQRQKGIIVFTDQTSKGVKKDELESVVNELSADRVSVFAVGVGTGSAIQKELEAVTDKYGMVSDYTTLLADGAMTDKISEEFKQFCEFIR